MSSLVKSILSDASGHKSSALAPEASHHKRHPKIGRHDDSVVLSWIGTHQDEIAVSQMAKHLGVTTAALYEFAAKHDVIHWLKDKRKAFKPQSNQRDDMIVRLYREGFTLPDIANKVGVTERTVSSIIARMGVTGRIKPWKVREIIDMVHLIHAGTGRHAVTHFMNRSIAAINDKWHKVNKQGQLEYYLSKESKCSRDEVEQLFIKHRSSK